MGHPSPARGIYVELHYLLWTVLCHPGSHAPRHLHARGRSVPISVTGLLGGGLHEGHT